MITSSSATSDNMRTMGRTTMKSTRRVLNHSLLRSFARTAHSSAFSALLARSAALFRSLAPELMGNLERDLFPCNKSVDFIHIQLYDHSAFVHGANHKQLHIRNLLKRTARVLRSRISALISRGNVMPDVLIEKNIC